MRYSVHFCFAHHNQRKKTILITFDQHLWIMDVQIITEKSLDIVARLRGFHEIFGLCGLSDFNCFKIRICFWNINGQYDMSSTPVINWLLQNVDVCFLSETHLKSGQKFDVALLLPLIIVSVAVRKSLEVVCSV